MYSLKSLRIHTIQELKVIDKALDDPDSLNDETISKFNKTLEKCSQYLKKLRTLTVCWENTFYFHLFSVCLVYCVVIFVLERKSCRFPKKHAKILNISEEI